MPETAENGAFPPPQHLSTEAMVLWRGLVPARARSPERQALLRVALEAFDELQRIRLELKGACLASTTATTGVLRLNPLLKHEKETRREFCRLWGDLDFDFNCAIDKRPQHPRRF